MLPFSNFDIFEKSNNFTAEQPEDDSKSKEFDALLSNFILPPPNNLPPSKLVANDSEIKPETFATATENNLELTENFKFSTDFQAGKKTGKIETENNSPIENFQNFPVSQSEDFPVNQIAQTTEKYQANELPLNENAKNVEAQKSPLNESFETLDLPKTDARQTTEFLPEKSAETKLKSVEPNSKSETFVKLPAAKNEFPEIKIEVSQTKTESDLPLNNLIQSPDFKFAFTNNEPIVESEFTKNALNIKPKFAAETTSPEVTKSSPSPIENSSGEQFVAAETDDFAPEFTVENSLINSGDRDSVTNSTDELQLIDSTEKQKLPQKLNETLDAQTLRFDRKDFTPKNVFELLNVGQSVQPDAENIVPEENVFNAPKLNFSTEISAQNAATPQEILQNKELFRSEANSLNLTEKSFPEDAKIKQSVEKISAPGEAVKDFLITKNQTNLSPEISPVVATNSLENRTIAPDNKVEATSRFSSPISFDAPELLSEEIELNAPKIETKSKELLKEADVSEVSGRAIDSDEILPILQSSDKKFKKEFVQTPPPISETGGFQPIRLFDYSQTYGISNIVAAQNEFRLAAGNQPNNFSGAADLKTEVSAAKNLSANIENPIKPITNSFESKTENGKTFTIDLPKIFREISNFQKDETAQMEISSAIVQSNQINSADTSAIENVPNFSGEFAPLKTIDGQSKILVAEPEKQDEFGRESPAVSIEDFAANFKQELTSKVAAAPRSVEPAKILEQIEQPVLQAILANAETDKPQMLKLRLRPAELGMVEIKLEKTGDGKIKVHFQTETEAARHVLNESIEQLKTSLKDSGWKVEQMEIASNANQFLSSNGGERRENQSRQQTAGGNNLKEQTAFGSDADLSDDLPANEPNRLLSVRA